MIDEEEEILNVLTRKELQNSRSRLRNAVNRDSSAADKRARQIASQLLAQSDNGWLTERADARKKTSALINGVVGLSSKVLNSLNITPRVVVNTTQVKYNNGRPVNCWTDFDSIHIGIDPQCFNPSDMDSMSELVHIVKGLTYHEGGHVLYTTAHKAMCTKVGCTGTHQEIPMPILAEHLNNPEIRISEDYVLMAWNMLEDQRIECQMVALSPVMARYFTTIVAKYVINADDPGNSWPWIVARSYLPSELRQAVRNTAEQRDTAHLIPLINETAMRYRNSRDYAEMHQAVLDMAQYLVMWSDGFNPPKGVDEHKFVNSTKSEQAKPNELDDFAPETPTNDQSGSNDDNSQESDEDTESGDKPTDSDGSQQSAGDEAGDKSFRDYLDSLVNDNISQTSHDEVHSFVGEINDAMARMAPKDESVSPMREDDIGKSTEVMHGMLDVLDRLVVQVDPSWCFYQDDGVIDPTAYLTRDPGDMNFWSGMNGDNANGHDLAVSLLIDSSGSMDHRMSHVSIAAMGIRKACEHYDIPCTITTFSDETRLVAEGDQDVDFVYIGAGGGTQIMDALMLLDHQQYGKRNHLVVILTDGEWTDTKDIRIWGKPTRHLMIVGVNVMHEMIMNKGANTAITISDVSQLAPLVTNALAGYFIN